MKRHDLMKKIASDYEKSVRKENEGTERQESKFEKQTTFNENIYHSIGQNQDIRGSIQNKQQVEDIDHNR